MKLIKPRYEIITQINGEQILKEIELAARTCYKSEGKIEYEPLLDTDIRRDVIKTETDWYAKSARVLIAKLIKMGHHAMLEFGGAITVKFICDRGVSHELVRHRIASFAQESTRYCNYEKDENITFIIPCWFKTMQEGIMGETIFIDECEERGSIEWQSSMLSAESDYNFLIEEQGWSPQQARSVLPNSLKTEINVSANIREWRHIFSQRTAKAAHPQMRELMCPLLDEFKRKIPVLFDDINYLP